MTSIEALYSAGAHRAKFLASIREIHEIRDYIWLLLANGGDPRIWPDPITRRNRYGMLTTPAPDEIAFASTTANPISPEGYAAASLTLDGLTKDGASSAAPFRAWFDDIRSRLTTVLGAPGAEAILAASGTDAELLVVGLALGFTTRSLTNIVVAPEETGRGVPMAAAGRHFDGYTAMGARAAGGGVVEGLYSVEAAFVPIRDPAGAPLDPASVDRAIVEAVERELRRGRDVLVHLLDRSKTGLSGLSREAARRLIAAGSGRVFVVVDACQLRCGLAQIRRDLSDGFMVQTTGSKYVGGPPFCGVILLPEALAAKVAEGAPLAKGLAAYTAAYDWPDSLREKIGLPFTSRLNAGLGLRWTAAFDGLESMAAIGEDLQASISDRFAREAIARATTLAQAQFHGDDASSLPEPRSIVPLTILDRDGAFASVPEATRIQIALREPGHGPICHIGQPVAVGTRTVLRVAASAYTIAGVAARMRAGYCFERAFKPVEADLDRLFEKWAFIERSVQRQGFR